MTIIHHGIIDRHAEDLAFLWGRRERALESSRFTRADLATLDDRIDAHLDGLRVAGEAGWQACFEALTTWGEDEEVFAAMVVGLDDRHAPGRVEALLAEVDASDEQVRRAMAAALGWHAFEHVEVWLRRWLSSREPILQELALAGFALHRRGEGLEPTLRAALQTGTASARAARAVGELGFVALSPCLDALLDADVVVRRHALCSLVRVDPAGVDERTVGRIVDELERSGAAGDSRELDRLVVALVHADPREAFAVQQTWARSSQHRRLAILVAETLGDPVLVPDLIAWMDDERLARRAGRAFSRITGIDLALDDLVREGPRDLGGPSDDPDDDEVTPDPDHALPWPSSLAVARAWRELGGFEAGTRYLEGRAIAASLQRDPTFAAVHASALLELARSGRPPHRIAAAAELGRWEPTRATIEARAPSSKPHVLPGWAAWLASQPVVPRESSALVSA